MIPQANVAQPENAPLEAASAPMPQPEAEQAEVDGLAIPYDLTAAADRAPAREPA